MSAKQTVAIESQNEVNERLRPFAHVTNIAPLLNGAKNRYMERACLSHCSCVSRAFSELETLDLAETDATIGGARSTHASSDDEIEQRCC